MPDLSQALQVTALEPYRVVLRPDSGASWFGPLAPQPPAAPPDVAGRRFDYPAGFNLQTRPRAYEPIGFLELRALADGYDLLRIIDDVNFHYAGTMQGGSVMGTLGASFAAGGDPDTVNTLSVDLTPSRGALLPGTQDDADHDRTVCYVAGEFVSYEQATLTAQYQYDLGKHGASAGYLRRGRFGSAIAAHAAGTAFVRLKPGTLFQLPYDKSQIGSTIYVKLLSFNLWGGGRQSLDQVASHAHVIGGAAPPLASVGALALSSDLQSGAATSSASGQGNPGGATSSGTAMVAAIVTTIGGAVLVSANGSFGPGAGSPAATKVTLTLTRTDANGTATIYTGTAMTLPSANNLPFSLTIADAPAAGSVAYQLVGTSDQGVAPFSGAYFSVSELRR